MILIVHSSLSICDVDLGSRVRLLLPSLSSKITWECRDQTEQTNTCKLNQRKFKKKEVNSYVDDYIIITLSKKLLNIEKILCFYWKY